MTTDSFRRHARACVDRSTHRALAVLADQPGARARLEALLRIVRRRSDLLVHPPIVHGEVPAIAALVHLARCEAQLVRDPDDWPGASGHPLRVVHDLASHQFGRYPVPRFLASAWFGDDTPGVAERRRWFVAHAQGQRFRSLALPIAMTRRMEHIFLRTPDHLTVDPALRRAEVLGLGGSAELAEAILATRLVEQFDDAERWRVALIWLVGCGDEIDLFQIRPLVDYLQANLAVVDLRGRTFRSVMRLVHLWHGQLGQARPRRVTWPDARWHGLWVPVAPRSDEPRGAEWTITELTDSDALWYEGQALRHCVVGYAQLCVRGRSSIWSLRHRWDDESTLRPVLTIEVHPSSRMIVQVRGRANQPASGRPLELVCRWAAREGLRFHPIVRSADGAELGPVG